MAEKPIKASLRWENRVAILDLQGDIDAFADAALNAAYAEAAKDKPSGILLNFKDVGYINSTGIALIVGLMVQARKSGLKLRAVGLSDHYTEIFKITRLSDFIPIFSDEAAALAMNH